MSHLNFDVLLLLLSGVALMASAPLPLLSLVVFSELVWFLFFLNSHLLYKTVTCLDFLTIFLIFLAIATIDLAVVLTLVLVQGALLQGEETSGSFDLRPDAAGSNSFGGGSLLRNSAT